MINKFNYETNLKYLIYYINPSFIMKIGYATFNQKMTLELEQQLNMECKYDLIQKRDWKLYFWKFTYEKWKQVFQCLEEARCQELLLWKNQTRNIIVQIQVPRFPNLRVLNLKQCQVNNIEALSFLNAPHLQQLNLSLNFLTTITALSKANFPKLKQLFVEKNYLQQLSSTNRIQLSWITDILSIDLQYFIKRPACEDVANMAKLQPLSLKKLIIKTQKGIIEQGKVLSAIARKYEEYLNQIGPNQ